MQVQPSQLSMKSKFAKKPEAEPATPGATAVAEAQSAPISNKLKVLLVDDHPITRQGMKALVNQQPNLEVCGEADNAAFAIELVGRLQPDLAIVDVRMPGMDGFELAELMRGTERTRRVPIMFLTAGSADEQRRFRGYEAGAVDFLTKPIEPHVLGSKIDVFIELWLERQEVARQRDELKAATAENARLLEESRRIAEVLREADLRKDEFLAILAHELRNPLAPLANGLKLMQFTGNDPDMVTRARDMMERQLSHLVRLVDDLLDVSRVSTGKVRLRPAPMDLFIAVDAAVEASRPAIEAGKHKLTVRRPEEPLWLNADATRISQIVGNLLTNAAKYTPAEGTIELSVERAGNEAVIRVADSGVGIPPEMLPRVFELFTQVGRSLDRSQGGLGIGLALVRKLVELHGGTVAATSEGPGKGSTFTVRLPLSRVRAEDSAEPESVLDASSRRILVVDDNKDGALSLAMLLKMSGHELEVAHDGREALEAVARFRPDVVFLDIGLPVLSGYDVAAALRADESISQPVLVAVTGWGSEADRRRAKAAGFNFHLTKPVEITALEKLLSEIGAGGGPVPAGE